MREGFLERLPYGADPLPNPLHVPRTRNPRGTFRLPGLGINFFCVLPVKLTGIVVEEAGFPHRRFSHDAEGFPGYPQVSEPSFYSCLLAKFLDRRDKGLCGVVSTQGRDYPGFPGQGHGRHGHGQLVFEVDGDTPAASEIMALADEIDRLRIGRTTR